MARIGDKDLGSLRRPTGSDTGEVQEGEGEGRAPAAANQAAAKKKVTSADAERLVSQAGFVRTGPKRVGLDLGDSTQGPIPLPEDDVDPGAWSTEGLAAAQSQLLQHHARLRRSKNKGKAAALRALVDARDADGDGAQGDADAQADEAAQAEAAAQLRAIVEQTPPDAAAMAALAKSVAQHFGVDVAGAPPGVAMMATSLLVAGHPENVAPELGGGLAVDALVGGVAQVVEEGRSAAEDARRRSEGVNRNLAMQRTFVPRR